MASPAKKNSAKRILIVDDHPMFREGISGLVEREPDLTVCGAASTVRQALVECERLKPDLVLADISLPGESGLELIKEIKARFSLVKMLVISMHEETLYAERALRSGAQGYVMKQEGPEKILHAIRQVLGGQVWLSGNASSRLLGSFSGRGNKKDALGRLSDRELEVLLLIGQGKDSHAIAKALRLSPKTVDAHRGNLKKKLELKNGTELICYAARWRESQQAARG